MSFSLLGALLKLVLSEERTKVMCKSLYESFLPKEDRLAAGDLDLNGDPLPPALMPRPRPYTSSSSLVFDFVIWWFLCFKEWVLASYLSSSLSSYAIYSVFCYDSSFASCFCSVTISFCSRSSAFLSLRSYMFYLRSLVSFWYWLMSDSLAPLLKFS